MLKYSLSPNPFPDSKELNNATIPSGVKIYVHYTPIATGEKLPYSFWINGQKINNESQAPYELNGGNGWFPAGGDYIVQVKDGNSAIKETATFTVGSVTPPPSDTKKITWKMKSTGEIIGEFSYKESQTEITIE